MCEIFICVTLHGYSNDLNGQMRRFVKASISGEHGNECFLKYLSSLSKYRFPCFHEETQWILAIIINFEYNYFLPFSPKLYSDW